MNTAMNKEVEATAARKRWEEPQIVLERSIFVAAQEGNPGGAPIPGAPKAPGFVSPMSESGGSGVCD